MPAHAHVARLAATGAAPSTRTAPARARGHRAPTSCGSTPVRRRFAGKYKECRLKATRRVHRVLDARRQPKGLQQRMNDVDGVGFDEGGRLRNKRELILLVRMARNSAALRITFHERAQVHEREGLAFGVRAHDGSATSRPADAPARTAGCRRCCPRCRRSRRPCPLPEIPTTVQAATCRPQLRRRPCCL